MDFEKLYSDVLNLDSSIRYAAIQNNTGVKIAGGFRSEIVPILSDEELQMMHYYASQRWQTRKNIEHKIGLQSMHWLNMTKSNELLFQLTRNIS